MTASLLHLIASADTLPAEHACKRQRDAARSEFLNALIDVRARQAALKDAEDWLANSLAHMSNVLTHELRAELMDTDACEDGNVLRFVHCGEEVTINLREGKYVQNVRARPLKILESV